MDVCRRYPGAEFWTNIFTPYPGSPIMNRAIFQTGHRCPQDTGGRWVDFFPQHYTVLPWLKGPAHTEVQTMREYLRVAFNRVPIGIRRKNPLQRIVHGMIGVPARWRLDHNVYAFPFELWLKDVVNRWGEAPKSKVDAHQLEAEAVTC